MDNIIHECITKRKAVKLLLDYPKREFTMNELSKLSGISYATVWRFVQKLDKAGIISTKVAGHSLECRLNESSPFIRELEKIFKAELSPQRLAVKKFTLGAKKINSIKKIILFGSVASGKEKLESDIDMAFIIDKKDKKTEAKIMEAAGIILEKFKLKIVPIIMTEKEFSENGHFKKEVMAGSVLYERRKRS